MKFIVALLLTAFLSFIGGLYMDWWIIAAAAFLVAALVGQRPGFSFLTGFLALFLLWGVLAWLIDQRNQHILSIKIAKVLPLGGNSFLLIIITAFIGALVAGFAALTGSYLRGSKKSSKV